ncbi:hypothetical protein CR513_40858, partial [Mucuna pruriens]
MNCISFVMIHYFEFSPGVLDKYYQKLIQSNNWLCELNQLPIPTSSPSFDQVDTATNSSHVQYPCSQQINSYSHEHITLPISTCQIGQAHN